MTKLFIVVPCYNEEEVLPTTVPALCKLVDRLVLNGKIDKSSGILFVDDGSRDRTFKILGAAHKAYKCVDAISLAANSGHQNALIAGLDAVKDRCDVAVTVDADLQDDISVIEEMLDKYEAGADIVYGVRSERQSDSFFKRNSAQLFYKLMSWLGAKTVYNSADFRLMSARAVKELLNYKERNLFLRGIVPLISQKTDTVYYTRQERTAGKSKYPLKKMLSFAWDGITSFSIRPITLILVLGLIIMLCSLAAFIYTLVSYFCGHATAGWSSLMISIWFLGGVQLFSVGIVGQYVGKNYMESKQRPRYSIAEALIHSPEEKQ